MVQKGVESNVSSFTIVKARAWLETKQATQLQKVMQSLALRVAQAKYVLVCLGKKGEIFRIESGHRLFPPRAPAALMEYAQHALKWYEEQTKTVWEKAVQRIPFPAREETESFIREWESVLEEMRRMVMQNWVHSDMNESLQSVIQLEQAVRVLGEMERPFSEIQFREKVAREELKQLEEQRRRVEISDAYDTVRKLTHSRNQLNAQKEELEKQWMEAWNRVAVVFEIMENEPAALDRLTHAQQEWLHTYVKNPLGARARDAHAHGLKVLVQLALEEVKRNIWPLPVQQMKYFENNLQHEMDSRFFEAFFWQNNQLDSTLMTNQKMVTQHPLHRSMQEWNEQLRQREQLLQETQAQLQQMQKNILKQREIVKQELQLINPVLQSHWNWVISLD